MGRLTKPEQDFETQFCEECMETGCIFHGEPNGCNSPNAACASFCYFTSCADKLREYEDAEERGLLVRLPCKVGDTVWVLRKGGYNLTGLHRGWDYYVDEIRFNYHALDLYGEFYTTREAAEQALKEAQP